MHARLHQKEEAMLFQFKEPTFDSFHNNRYAKEWNCEIDIFYGDRRKRKRRNQCSSAKGEQSCEHSSRAQTIAVAGGMASNASSQAARLIKQILKKLSRVLCGTGFCWGADKKRSYLRRIKQNRAHRPRLCFDTKQNRGTHYLNKVMMMMMLTYIVYVPFRAKPQK